MQLWDTAPSDLVCYEVLTGNGDKIAANGWTGSPGRNMSWILRDFPGAPVEDKIVHDFQVIADDPEVQIVVETMGGLNPAYPFVKKPVWKPARMW